MPAAAIITLHHLGRMSSPTQNRSMQDQQWITWSESPANPTSACAYVVASSVKLTDEKHSSHVLMNLPDVAMTYHIMSTMTYETCQEPKACLQAMRCSRAFSSPPLPHVSAFVCWTHSLFAVVLAFFGVQPPFSPPPPFPTPNPPPFRSIRTQTDNIGMQQTINTACLDDRGKTLSFRSFLQDLQLPSSTDFDYCRSIQFLGEVKPLVSPIAAEAGGVALKLRKKSLWHMHQSRLEAWNKKSLMRAYACMDQ